MQAPKRIANLVGVGTIGLGYEVPEAAVGVGYRSEQVETRTTNLFLNEFDRALTDTAYVDAALRCQDEGFDAVVVNSFGDFGIGAMAAALDIPAVGAGQTAVRFSAELGERFGIVTVWPPATQALYERVLGATGLADRCAGIVYVTGSDELDTMEGDHGVMARMRSGGGMGTAGEAIVDRIEDACRRVVRDGRADVLVLGCTCMSPVHAELARRLDVPVIDPLTAAHKTAESLLALGLQRAAPTAPARGLPAFRGLVAGTGAGPGSVVPEDGCGDACVVVGSVA